MWRDSGVKSFTPVDDVVIRFFLRSLFNQSNLISTLLVYNSVVNQVWCMMYDVNRKLRSPITNETHVLLSVSSLTIRPVWRLTLSNVLADCFCLQTSIFFWPLHFQTDRHMSDRIVFHGYALQIISLSLNGLPKARRWRFLNSQNRTNALLTPHCRHNRAPCLPMFG